MSPATFLVDIHHEAKAVTLKAALEIGRRLLLAGIAVLLDTKNRVQEIATIYVGSVNSAQVRVGEVFRDAVRRNSAAIIVAHNHPSGDPTPSPEDVAVTREIAAGGRLLDVELLDHLVVGRSGYVSLKQRRLGLD